MINWDKVISKLSNGSVVSAHKSNWNLSTPGYLEIYKLWEDANFNMSAIKWINYYPGIHYPEEIDTEMCSKLGIVKFRSWISQIDPGYYAPWHWDVDDDENKYINDGPITRYSCFICKSSPGHMFQIGNTQYTGQQQGTVVKWPSYRDWHAGSNAGLIPKYMYHLIGKEKNDA